MVNIIRARLKQGHRTVKFPDDSIALPERFRGRLKIDQSKCADSCKACVDVCPTQALWLAGNENGPGSRKDGRLLKLDLGRCIFCSECTDTCPEGAISYTNEFRMAVRSREHLSVTGDELELAAQLKSSMRRLFGRSLKLRQVSAGGCNGCEVEANATGNIVFDASRFGIQFVASPRHADGLLITGPVTRQMELALRKTYDAVPAPKVVIACGSCAISGGPFRDQYEVLNGCEGILPVDLYIPGSPPHPMTILDGLLRLMGRIESGKRVPR